MTELDSPNFDFLKLHHDLLFQYAVTAERFVFDDPNASLFRSRQLAEVLLRYLCAKAGMDPSTESFDAMLRLLRRHRIIDNTMRSYFEEVRSLGNKAAHEGADDRELALRSLFAVHQIAAWFHETMDIDPGYRRKAFRYPARPENPTELLELELEELRAQSVRYQQELNEAHGKAVRLEEVEQVLERESQNHYMALQQAAQLIFEKDALISREQELRLRMEWLSLQSKLAATDELHSLIERSQRASKTLRQASSDEVHLPLLQLRIVAQKRCKCAGLRVLAQRSSGGFVMTYCAECGKEKLLSTSEFFGVLEITVSCRKCSHLTKKSSIGTNYGFRCENCGWECWLGPLLPDASQLRYSR